MNEDLGRAPLLTAIDMAHFATDGFLIIENMVPKELNEAVHHDEVNMNEEKQGYHFWENSEAIRKIFDLPRVKGAIQSLVGANSRYNHSFLHVVKSGNLKTQCWHIDSGTMNPDPRQFDIQAFYFAHDTPIEMGPTLFLPGSHLRRMCYWDISRYKNIVGQRHLVAKPGTIVFTHQDIWHCAQANQTDNTRYVFKIRLDPQVQQRNQFDTDGYESQEVMEILKKPQEWSGQEYAKDAYQKLRFWRYLTGNDAIGRPKRYRD
jgi:ectoine hydroxylase-related dioxygenase (phytanoyl-CoA dioxygenase family)